jgi:PAS domain S-box-containing protein
MATSRLFLFGGDDEESGLDFSRKVLLLNIVSLTGIAFLVVFGIYSLVVGDLVQAVWNGAVALLFIISLVFLHKTRKFTLVSRFNILIFSVLLLYLFSYGDPGSTGPLWSFTFPLFVMPLIGIKAGTVVTLIFLGLIFGVFQSGHLLFDYVYTLDYKIKYFGAFMGVSILAFFFEYFHSEYEINLSDRNIRLQRTMDKVKERETALRQSDNTCRELVERSEEGIILIQDKVIKLINPALSQMGGYTIEDCTGKVFTDFIAEEKKKEVLANYLLRLANVSTPKIYKTIIKCKDGSTFEAEIRAGRLLYKGNVADLVFIKNLTDKNRNRRKTDIHATLMS